MNIRQMIAVMEAYANGAKIQTRCTGSTKWMDVDNPGWSWAYNDYRVAPKEPTLRPWNPSEIPVGALIRHKNRECPSDMWMIIGREGAIHIKNTIIDLHTAYERWEYSFDNGSTWRPCGVYES